MEVKTCSKCKIQKPLIEFYPHKRDGYRAECKDCGKQYAQSDKRKEQVRRSRCSGSGKEANRRYAQSKRGKAAHRRYRQSEKGKISQMRVLVSRRLIAGCENTLTHDQWQAVLKQYKNRCVYCGRKVKLTVDHIIPISLGGTHTKKNVLPACMDCNIAKSNRLLLIAMLSIAKSR